MKKFFLIIATLLFSLSNIMAQCGDELVDDCASDIGGATYLKDFRVQLEKAEKNKPAPVQRISVVLNSGTQYKFNVCNAPEYEGKAIVQLYDNARLLGSTLNISTGKLYDSFVLSCSKNGVYYIFVSFQEGMEGCSAAILSYVEQ